MARIGEPASCHLQARLRRPACAARDGSKPWRAVTELALDCGGDASCGCLLSALGDGVARDALATCALPSISTFVLSCASAVTRGFSVLFALTSLRRAGSAGRIE